MQSKKNLMKYVILLLILAYLSPTLAAGVVCFIVLRRLWELEKNGRL